LIAGANKLGIKGFVFRSVKQLEHDFKKNGVVIP